jgi:hypothetical protein
MPSREYAVDGDEGFIGLNSRDNPVNLGKNFVSKSQNIRMDRGIATVRKGAERLTAGTLIGEDVYGSCVYTKADGAELIVIAVADGLYTYNRDTGAISFKVLFPGVVNGATFATADGITVTVTKNGHGLLLGSKVHMTTSNANCGGTVVITAVTTNTFSYVLTKRPGVVSGTCSYNATNFIETEDEVQLYQATGIGYVYILRGFAKKTLKWDGNVTIVEPGPSTHTNFPNSRHGIYYGNRHIVQTDSNSIQVSHYLEDDAWSALDMFSINDGSSDRLVGIAPWTLNEFVIFMRNSIFYAAVGVGANAGNDAATEADSYIKSLATDVGCIAKGSIVQAGGGIIFLSDNGVYMLNPSGAGQGGSNTPEGMRLLTIAEPLSAPINDIIARINYNYVDRAIATYWDNRYYLAVPLDDSTKNNAVIVYNFVNKAWESIDTYPVNQNVSVPVSSTFGTVMWTSGDYFEVFVYTSGAHGFEAGDKINIVFTQSYSGATPLTGVYPQTTYTVESSGLSSTYFKIRIPYSTGYYSPAYGYPTGNCTCSKAESFSFNSFCVAKNGPRRRLFMLNDKQGLFLLEELDYDEFGVGTGTPFLPFDGTGFIIPATLNELAFTPLTIVGDLTTRAYSFQTNREKRFSSLQADLLLQAGSSIHTSFITVNPDSNKLILDYGSPTDEDFILRLPVRKSGYYSQVNFLTTNLRPSIRSVTVEAIVPGHMTQSRK